MPSAVIKAFVSNGWTLKFCNGSITEALGYDGVTDSGIAYSGCSGLALYTSKTILVQLSAAPANYEPSIAVVIHEFGHFVLYTAGIEYKLQPCINAETEALIALAGRDYCKSNSQEFFADAFSQYCCLGAEEFDKKMPLTKAVIEEALSIIAK